MVVHQELFFKNYFMCGINGFNFNDPELIKKMSKITSQRGPDFTGFFLSENYSTAHNRLSIIDPEDRSNQPFILENFILSFNGEIYNYLDLKKGLIEKGYKFKTKSDTEVILKLFQQYGKESFKMLSGIFALSLFVKDQNKIYLIRDQVGVKPLYYSYDISNKKFIYSSLIKPIILASDKKELNINAIKSYANFNRNDFRETFFKNIFKVLPGELIEIQNGDLKKTKFINFNFYKNVSPHEINKDISENFSKQFLSDVPVALSLSGGFDSNLIFHELLKNKGTNFANYSVYFKDSIKFSEDFKIAKNISKSHGVKFNAIEVSSNNFYENAEKVVDIAEEPIGNTNSISNYILSKNISEKVVFTGDGGDEIFTGYNKYKSIFIISQLRKLNLFKKFRLKFENKNFNRLFIDNSKELFLSFSEQNLFKSVSKVYRNFEYIKTENINEILNHTKENNYSPNLSNVMFHDLDTWIPNDILLRNDKIYANEGIEARVPFLDRNIIEKYLMINDFSKFGILLKSKNLLTTNYKEISKRIVKKKLGFNSPFSRWLRNEIFEFAELILNKDYYDSSNYIDLIECGKLIKKHRDTFYDPYLIWNLISLQIFLRKNKF